jgi:hypothetical protein
LGRFKDWERMSRYDQGFLAALGGRRAALKGLVVAAVFLAVAPAPDATAQTLIVYPAKGQSQAQQEQDQFACYQWAKQQSGYDPMAPAGTGASPPPTEGGVLCGAAGGAALGAIGGAIAGDAGQGAAIGAATGALLGGIKKRRSQRRQQEWERQQAAQQAQVGDAYNRAFAACMEARGYTVR